MWLSDYNPPYGMLGLLAFVCYVIRMSWQRPAMTMILALFWVSNHLFRVSCCGILIYR